jgi:hypothetical protein
MSIPGRTNLSSVVVVDRPVKLALYGVGAVSWLIAKRLLQKRGLEIDAAIDVSDESWKRSRRSSKLNLIVTKGLNEAF